MKKIIEVIYKRKLTVIFLLFILSIFIFLLYPRSYKSFFRKAELKETEELRISFHYNARDEHEAMISDKYCCDYLINDKKTIERVQQVFESVSLKPKYTEGSPSVGLLWGVMISGQGEDYILSMHSSIRRGGKKGLDASLLDKKRHFNAEDKDIFPGWYEISREDNEKIIQVLFEAIKDNIKDMTIQDAVRLSEENAQWRDFMYYYMSWGDRTDINQLYIPILNTDMKIEVWHERIGTDTEYIEPIRKAVLYDKDGKEYEYFSEEAREVLRKEAEEKLSEEGKN